MKMPQSRTLSNDHFYKIVPLFNIPKLEMMVFIYLCLNLFLPIYGYYQSYTILSSFGMEFQPTTNLQLLSSTSRSTRIRCSASCNQLPSCRTFDYDTVSQRCRLFEGDSTTGSIVASSSSTSRVGTIIISSSSYVLSHNQPCSACDQDRYEVCSLNTSRCQCPERQYWNGAVCALQLFENLTCTQVDACRSDLNLTCSSDCYGEFQTCSKITNNTNVMSTMSFGTTVAGGCNGSSSTNQTLLYWPAGIVVSDNNTLYVANYDGRLLAFQLGNRTGLTIATFTNWLTFLFIDEKSSTIYVSVYLNNLVYLVPSNRTIPPDGVGSTSCVLNRVSMPKNIILDNAGNLYISSYDCNWVMRWAPNATSGIHVVGSSVGSPGNNSQSLTGPYGLALDEPNSFLYVADRFNHRIQRFILNGTGVGVTIAGGNGQGSAANQLNAPTEIYLSKLDGSLYIADSQNNRVLKWPMNSTVGVTVAGSPTGVNGMTPYLMDLTYAMAITDNETYLFVSDCNNNRIQRFNLKN